MACIPIITILAALLTLSSTYEMLGEVPVTFRIDGNVSYTPTSGGTNIPGYKMVVGFYHYQWIGVKFMSLTSRSTYDIVVVQRETTAVGGYYKTTVRDFFVSSARQNKLLADSNNNMDRQSISYDESNYYEVQIYRTKGDTQGEDWQGGQFLMICFYTSSNTFDQNTWSGLTSSCYGYDISEDYISTFQGRYLKAMAADGASTLVYGGIEGPVLQMQLFWYVPRATLSSANVYIRTGDKISEELGYDYYKCGSGSGDYFGAGTGSLTLDSVWSGFNDGACSVTSSATGTKISYSRKVYTFDEFDSTITNQTSICLIVGSRQSCQTLSLPLLFPVMTVDSALVVAQPHLGFSWLLILLLAYLIIQP